MSRVASWLAESTTMISNGGSWTIKLSSNAAMFLASLRTVVTTLTSNAARNRVAVMMVSTWAARGTIFKAGPRLLARLLLWAASSRSSGPARKSSRWTRSFDKTMPEELNRIVADQLSDVLFAPTATSRKNLGQENVTAGVHVVGNSVIDALIQNLAIAEKKSDVLARLGLTRRGYMLLT